MKFGSRIFGLLAIPAVALLMLLAAEFRPGYFSNVTYLGGLLLLEIVLAAVWHYETWFFPAMMLTFLWAGSDLPMAGAGSAVRWVFLAVGALVGIVKWAATEHRKPFGALHVAAFLCILSAAVSGMVSSRTATSLLKSSSLFLLFVYASGGARVAIAGRETKFFLGLLNACEIASYLAGISYGVLHYELLGNPNSLGAVMGVVVVPVLLWGVLIAQQPGVRHRRTAALCLAVYLLCTSISRAGLLACGVVVTVVCLSLHRQRLLMKAAFFLVFLAAALAVVQPAQFDSLVSAFSEDVVYKGNRDKGLLGSRQSPWQETVDVIKESPWFGSGFGTDLVRGQLLDAGSMFRTAGTTREHGNSYLALLEYVGLLGIIPFLVLICLVLRLALRVCYWMWKTADPHHYAVPLAAICMAGLIHAFFEDWLFAVGYYLNILFWTFAFILSDLQPHFARQPVVSSTVWSRTPTGAAPIPLSASQ
jgi:O-antigen ligase